MQLLFNQKPKKRNKTHTQILPDPRKCTCNAHHTESQFHRVLQLGQPKPATATPSTPSTPVDAAAAERDLKKLLNITTAASAPAATTTTTPTTTAAAAAAAANANTDALDNLRKLLQKHGGGSKQPNANPANPTNPASPSPYVLAPTPNSTPMAGAGSFNYYAGAGGVPGAAGAAGADADGDGQLLSFYTRAHFCKARSKKKD